MGFDTSAILSEMENRRAMAADLLKLLIREDTTNPPGNEHRAGRIVEEFFAARGIPYETHAKEPGRSNVIGRVGSGGAPRVFVPCHLDTVPAGDGWTMPPLEGIERDGFIYGRGALDNKGALAGTLCACDYLKNVEKLLKGTFLAAAVADEECGSGAGLEFLTAAKLVAADMAWVPDMSNGLSAISVAEKGLLDVEITAHGKQAHGSRPELGVNAALALADLMIRTEGWLPGGVPEHPLLKKPSVCVGLVQGGIAPNVVPAFARAVFNIRYLPGQTPGGILAEMSRAAKAVEALLTSMSGANSTMSAPMRCTFFLLSRRST
ncbi:MAG: M20/M25/M40 family metallo-hydrolase, partial [Planctomycetota bacterium]|nr:M20/M25/M40 family metallo-hydrolase [Planctomycetota bacterium]